MQHYTIGCYNKAKGRCTRLIDFKAGTCGRGFFAMVLVANQKPRIPVNHMNNLCMITIHLI